MKILTIGNSFTWSLKRYFPEVVHAAGEELEQVPEPGKQGALRHVDLMTAALPPEESKHSQNSIPNWFISLFSWSV